MNWKSLFQTIDNISPEQTRAFLDSAPEGTYQLLDVRQPNEYSQEHIPGALLIPLKELPDRVAELSPDLKTIVYCRSGVRSRSGTQILNDRGFTSALNMTGGILGWKGHKAMGDESLGLDWFLAGEFDSAVSMAYAMEAGLQRFYVLLAENTPDQDCRALLQHMAGLEDGHMARLSARYPELGLQAGTQVSGEPGEGGIDGRVLLDRFGSQLDTTEKILHMAMMFESQAYDLYSRLSRTDAGPELGEFFTAMAAEEKRHLERLTRELEERIA